MYLQLCFLVCACSIKPMYIGSGACWLMLCRIGVADGASFLSCLTMLYRRIWAIVRDGVDDWHDIDWSLVLDPSSIMHTKVNNSCGTESSWYMSVWKWTTEPLNDGCALNVSFLTICAAHPMIILSLFLICKSTGREEMSFWCSKMTLAVHLLTGLDKCTAIVIFEHQKVKTSLPFLCSCR